MARPIRSAVNRPFIQPRPDAKTCDWPGCAQEGEHRAPKSREHLTDYYWFCLDHVRDYNKAWNYYADRTPEEIEEMTRRDTIWQRPTWKLGGGPYSQMKDGLADDFGLFDEDESAAQKKAEQATGPDGRRIPNEQREALRTLGLQVSFQEIKDRYKALVKTLHPDLNGGKKDAEEQLKVINSAYASLKSFFA